MLLLEIGRPLSCPQQGRQQPLVENLQEALAADLDHDVSHGTAIGAGNFERTTDLSYKLVSRASSVSTAVRSKPSSKQTSASQVAFPMIQDSVFMK